MTVNTAAPIEVTAQAMAAHLQQQLAPTQLEVLDESWKHEGHAGANGTGFGTHFLVRIATPAFVGKSRVAQHRLVYDALRIFFDHGAHAVAIETL
jgi:BolA protein